jgi:putative acetyltransferase
MPEIITLTSELAPAARRMIYTVAHAVFPSERTLDESLAFYQTEWPLHDLDDIQASYFDNGGVFIAMVENSELIGTGALRQLDEGVCELKRFWFLPAYHGLGVAGILLNRLLELARGMGYHTMRLETSPHYQPRAYAFYHKHGFYDILRYGDDPDDIGMEKKLG